ncbi:hypothetical protein F4806DRAFT_501618 [Annulohypoxylon nitens]|nr:hypothetical protein F4806DRAFT_501618 [Annulohypoxylon nitens]
MNPRENLIVRCPKLPVLSRASSDLVKDLHRVERAVRHCEDTGVPMFRPTRDISRIISHARGSFDHPKTYGEIMQLLVASYTHQMRLAAMASRAKPSSNPGSDESSSDESSTSSFLELRLLPDHFTLLSLGEDKKL